MELDLETLTIARLKVAGAVTALVPADNIAGKIRRGWTPDAKFLRVRRTGGLPTEQETGWLRRYRLQVEAFAADETTAFRIAAAAETALRALAGTTLPAVEDTPGAVVGRVGNDVPMNNLPDPDFPGADRYLFGMVLYAHPIAA